MFRNMPLGIFSEGTELREKLRLALVGGFEGVDIDIEQATALAGRYSCAYVKGMLDSFALKPGAWKLPFTIDAEEKVYDEGIQKIEGYAETAKRLNLLRTLATVSSADRAKEDLCRERLASVAKLLARYGCAVGLDCPGDCAAKIKEAGIVLNARYWHLFGAGLQELEKVEWKRVVYVIISDVGAEGAGRFLPGETGVVDLAGFLKVLADAGYDGPVSPELPDRNLMTLPEEMAVRLLGGGTMRVWNRVFPKKEEG